MHRHVYGVPHCKCDLPSFNTSAFINAKEKVYT
jgi:hypothetical protein